MWRGRNVRVYDRQNSALIKSFQVGVEDPDLAIQAILTVHPELARHSLKAGSTVSETAVTYTNLRAGEVRDIYDEIADL